MSEQQTMPHQFDAWKRLAASDPEAFEAQRRRYIDETIARAPPDRQERLRRLQWRIEQARRQAGTPLAGCIALYRMMWDSVLGQDGLLPTLRSLRREPRRDAKVLAFPGDRKPH